MAIPQGIAKKFDVDYDKAKTIVSKINAAITNETGMFAKGWHHYIPPYSLPDDIEDPDVYAAIQNRQVAPNNPPANPDAAARMLFTRGTFERRTNSDILWENTLNVWKKDRWIFNPYDVANACVEDINSVIRDGFCWYLDKEQTGYLFKESMRRLVDEFEGNPAHIIDGKTWKDSYEKLQTFYGYGPGVSAMLISEFNLRGLASIIDPENMQFKMDIQHTRVFVNTDVATIPTAYQRVRHETAQRDIGPITGMACEDVGADPWTMHDAAWVIGSKGCTRLDTDFCKDMCPVYDDCSGNMRGGTRRYGNDLLDEHKYPRKDKIGSDGTFVLRHPDGSKIDERKDHHDTLGLVDTYRAVPKKTLNLEAQARHLSKKSGNSTQSEFLL